MAFLDVLSKVAKTTGNVVSEIGAQAQKGGEYLADPENQAKINAKVDEIKDKVNGLFAKDKTEQQAAEPAAPQERKDVTPADEDIVLKYEDVTEPDKQPEVLQPRQHKDDEI
jgi:hypothetical protein